MASVNPKIVGINSEWLARDRNRYIVRIPTPNGSANFDFRDYKGSSVLALKAAKSFQKKMIKQLLFDRKYLKDHGEVIERVHLHVNNKSGHRGVCRTVSPNGFQSPRIIWTAFWSDKSGKQRHKYFSLADPSIKNEKDAEQKAVAYANEKRNGKFK